jgi:CheY-like chemotaxis protein
MMEILVVDDNPEYLKFLKEAFTLSGYDVHTAEDGIEGCEKLSSLDIDLIISDIRMPRLDGIKLHAFARELNSYKKKKFVFLSGYRELFSSIPGMNPELDFFLEKTTPLDAIVRFVDRLLFGEFAGKWV